MNGGLVEHVTGSIRTAILDGRLEPGEHIAQKTLADELGTSRLPVREALRQLQSEGLVTLKTNAGARVARLTLTELNEIYLMRERLEPLALEASIPHLTEEALTQLGDYVETMEELAAGGDKWGWLELDKCFHLATFDAAPLPRVLALVNGFWNQATRYRRAYTEVMFPTSLAVQNAEHRLLLNAIERRDQTDAEMILAMHIRRTRTALNEHRELFADRR